MNQVERGYHRIAVTLLVSMIGFYLLSIFSINFSITPSFYITDMYTDVMVAAEMWEQKTLFPEEWVFGNQLYIMATPVLAALFCGITNNAFTAMAAASSLMAILVIASFNWMLKPVFRSLEERCVGILAFLAVVVLFGDAVKVMNGWQLFFTMCSYYACYAINAFLAFGCYLRCDSKLSVFTAAVTCVLSFAMGIQSLRQTAVMVIPLMAIEFIRILFRIRQHEPVRAKSLYLVLAIGISNAAGIFFKQFLNVNQSDMLGEIGFAGFGQMPGAVWDSIANACSLFSRDTSQPNMVYRSVLLVYVLAAVLVCVKKRKKTAQKTKTLLFLFAMSIAAIFGIDVLLTMNVRGIYYFMLFPLLACLSVYVYGCRPLASKIPLLVLLCVVFGVSCTREVIPALQKAQNRMEEQSCEISSYLLEHDYTVVYSSWNKCEDIAVASDGKIKAGFWTEDDDPFIPVKFLCKPEIYTVDAEKAIYLFYGEENAKIGVEKAKSAQIEMTFVAKYPEKEIYLYTAPVNLLQTFSGK